MHFLLFIFSTNLPCKMYFYSSNQIPFFYPIFTSFGGKSVNQGQIDRTSLIEFGSSATKYVQ